MTGLADLRAELTALSRYLLTVHPFDQGFQLEEHRIGEEVERWIVHHHGEGWTMAVGVDEGLQLLPSCGTCLWRNGEALMLGAADLHEGVPVGSDVG